MSKKAWNNVLIFSMLLMILLFNTTNNILVGSDSDNPQTSLLPEQSSLLTLQTPEVTIEKIGQGWRTNPATQVDEEQLYEVVSKWQSLTMGLYDDEMPNSMPVIVIAWLAGENSGRIFQLYEDGKNTLVLYQQERFLIRNVTVDQLVIKKKN